MSAKQIFFLAVLSIAAEGYFAKSALAQAEENLVLKVYDVGDLVMDVRDYEYPGSEFGAKYLPPAGGMGGGGFGGGGGGFGGGGSGGGGGQFQFAGGGRLATSPTSTSMGNLIEVLYSVVAPDSWKENGGSSEARAFGNSLVVSQTPAVHAQIEVLLNQLRAGSGERKSITVDARWLLLSSDELDQLYVIKNGTPQLSSNGNRTLDRERLAEYTRMPTSVRAITSCFSGQLVYVVSGTKRNIVSGYIPVVGSLDDGDSTSLLASSQDKPKFRLVSESNTNFAASKSVGYQPMVEKQNIGALLEIRPTLIQGSKAAILDLKATVTDSAESVDGALQPISSGPPEVDRVAVQSQEMATTLRVPLGEPVLVGGMTNVSISLVESEERPQLYLVLEVK